MDFQLEIQTSIQGFNAKVKSKATIHSLGGRFKAIFMQWKVMKKTDEQVLEIISKKTGSSGYGQKQASLSSMWFTK